MTDLSIIILNYKTKKLTLDCINSVVKNSKGISLEIIVIDNASNDGSVEALRRSIKRLSSQVGIMAKLIVNKENLGFAKANNQGMGIAGGNYILLLNSDTLVHDNVLGEMLEWMRKHPKVGAATCALRNKDGSLQGTGGYFPTLLRVFSWMFFLDDIPILDKIIKPFHPMHGQSPFYKGTKYYLTRKEIDWITGAFMLIRKKALKDVGAFDEDYFMYSEDTDLCYRIKNAGWEIWYLPDWGITHLGGASSTSMYPILSEYEGVKLFYKKNVPFWQFPVLRVFLKSGALLRMFILGIIKDGEVIKTYAKAFKIA
ncbi:hypothetical protein A2865_03650 [Candidatus Woesebacteria bacterium RIFCSPHIGHO2_01_FULL_39_17]|uniref:Family 2 glycosyl transferase n=1 Tax=Candidatus Woesebacteria bacterium GW2011_GWA1_39_21b TaxID=1618551 RepID=A0A0G0N7Y2_9BACT|nr:MAG: family 2 glycosyl transferase [Microgenomates group bacterium GW2011_GWC1_38_12]KKR11563.1 MAG: family 2 glycosyl transferase [Candidatus Woesebacteria bacterium GW2011_GWA1_39_21b]OGM23358.1 MAG: hypothetical protein A2865_03650 [Candidatus Woesebacteria bacterium RIFCSPHIGHO2_01_FULL_39_17]